MTTHRLLLPLIGLGLIAGSLACTSSTPAPTPPAPTPVFAPDPDARQVPTPTPAPPRPAISQAALAADPKLITRSAEAWKGQPIRLRGYVRDARSAGQSGSAVRLLLSSVGGSGLQEPILVTIDSPNPPAKDSCIELSGTVSGIAPRDAVQLDAPTFALVHAQSWQYDRTSANCFPLER